MQNADQVTRVQNFLKLFIILIVFIVFSVVHKGKFPLISFYRHGEPIHISENIKYPFSQTSAYFWHWARTEPLSYLPSFAYLEFFFYIWGTQHSKNILRIIRRLLTCQSGAAFKLVLIESSSHGVCQLNIIRLVICQRADVETPGVPIHAGEEAGQATQHFHDVKMSLKNLVYVLVSQSFEISLSWVLEKWQLFIASVVRTRQLTDKKFKRSIVT